MKIHFYHCEICGKLIMILSDTGVPTICCGRPMRELLPNTSDGTVEKHVPVFTVSENIVSVKIGSAPHPMTEAHGILWAGLLTDSGFAVKELHPGEVPETWFVLSPGEKVLGVYAYCNIHGLFAAEGGESK